MQKPQLIIIQQVLIFKKLYIWYEVFIYDYSLFTSFSVELIYLKFFYLDVKPSILNLSISSR